LAERCFELQAQGDEAVNPPLADVTITSSRRV
jgi:hypothetical protein